MYHVLDLFTGEYDSERTRPYILAFQKFMMCLCMAINVAGSSWMPLLFDCYVMSTSKERLKLLRFFLYLFSPSAASPSPSAFPAPTHSFVFSVCAELLRGQHGGKRRLQKSLRALFPIGSCKGKRVQCFRMVACSFKFIL